MDKVINKISATVHLKYLDGLRGLTAMYVVIHHEALMAPRKGMSSIFKVIFFPFGYGRYAVDAFIVISGFCLILPIIKNGNNGKNLDSFLVFYLKRAKRILPTYYIAMAISLLLIATAIGDKTGTLWDLSIPVKTSDIITHILLIQDMFPENISKINYVFWSISVEWRIYLLFPLIVILWKKYNKLLLTASIVVFSLVLWILITAKVLGTFFIGSYPHYIGLFAIGMLSAHIAFGFSKKTTKIRENVNWKIVILIAVSFLIIINIIKIGLSQNQPLFVQKLNNIIIYTSGFEDISIAVLIGALAILLQTNRLPLMHKLLSLKPIAFIGSFAYSIYLVHAPVLQLLNKFILLKFNFSANFSTLFYLFLAFPLVLMLSYIFFIIAERPFLNKVRKSSPQYVSRVIN